MSLGRIVALSMLLAAGAGSAAPQAPSDAQCGAGGCAVGADDAAMSAVDRASGDHAAGDDRAIDHPFRKPGWAWAKLTSR